MAATLQLGNGTAFEEPDDRFKHRLNLIRRLFANITHNDQSVLSAFDSWRTNLRALERKRAHLAHGAVAPNIRTMDGVIVYDRRETREYPKQHEKLRARNATLEEHRDLWDGHRNISYTSADLVQLEADINRANGHLTGLLLQARKRSRELTNQTPHGR